MPFELLQKPAFVNDLISLPRATQKKVSRALERIRQDPFRAGGKAEKCFKHLYKNVYRYRIGDSRIIYAVGDRVVSVLAIGKREDIYDRFNGRPEEVAQFSASIDSAQPQVFQTAPYDSAPAHLPDGPDTRDEDSEQEPEPESPHTGNQETLLHQLLEQWNIPAAYQDRILGCRTWEELFDLDLPEAILERILHIICPPSLEQLHEQPNLELNEPSDIDRFLDGSLKKFLLKLDPEQERVAKRSLQGPTLVKGGPGTGKSLVALYRIRSLLAKDAQEGLFETETPSILLVTYSTSLVEACRQLLEDLLDGPAENVHVTNLDKIIREIIVKSGQNFRAAEINHKLAALAAALQKLTRTRSPSVDANAIKQLKQLRRSYIIDEFDWVIEGRSLSKLEDYLTEDRRGRGIRFDRSLRTAVWHLHELYKQQLHRKGLSTWDLYRAQALSLLKDRPDLYPKYDAVIVDEAQDLTPAGLSLCVELCKRPEGLYLTADANQSIYNRRFAWSRVHDALQFRGRTTILKYNYRSTHEIAAAAIQLLSNSEDADIDALHTQSVYHGKKPLLVECHTPKQQYEAAGRFLKEAARELKMPVWSGAVLAPSNREAVEAAKCLERMGIPAKAVKGKDLNLDEKIVKCMTIHSAKGLEFPMVAVIRVDDSLMPGLWVVSSPEEEKTRIEDQRRLLFVALSRAMRRLAVTYSVNSKSRFIEELDPALWKKVIV